MLTDKKILDSERNAVYVKSTEGSRLTGTVTQNKNVFDKFPQLIMTKFNDLIDLMIELNLDSVPIEIFSRYTKIETDDLVENETANLVESIDINTETGVITVTKKDGTVYSVDTALEKVPATFEFVTGDDEYFLKVTNVDGTTSQVNVTALMNQYTFGESADISFAVTTSGTTTGVTATIKNNSVTWDKLDPTIKAYFDDLAVEVNTDKELVLSAKTEVLNASQTVTANTLLVQGYKETAEAKAIESKSYAVGGTSSRSGEDTDNSRYYALQAQASKNSAEASSQSASNYANTASTHSQTAIAKASESSQSALSASQSATSASTSAQTATTKASEASASAQTSTQKASEASQSSASASQSASTATTKATEATSKARLSESYAIGGTGSRSGEDTDNAKYYMEQARDIASGDFATHTELNAHTSDTSNPHSVTKSQVGLGNVPNVTTNNQVPTYTQASTLANLVSGEKLSISLGKVMKAIADLITHLADSVLHITASERTSWNAKANASDLTTHTQDQGIHVTNAEKQSWNGKANASNLQANLGTSWESQSGYVTQEVTAQGIMPADTPIIDLISSTDGFETEQEEWGKVFKAVSGSGKITFYAKEATNITLNLNIKVVR